MNYRRFIDRVLHRTHSRDKLPSYVSIGRATYGVNRNTIAGMSPDAPVTIGQFCSVGPEVRIFSRADHPLDLPSTYPFRTLLLNPEGGNQDAVSRGSVTIGNDVWIGCRAMIVSGVAIGNGAVIAAGAVVTRDVNKYAIVAGSPAVEKRRRFTDEQIAALEKIAWWDWPIEKIRTFESAFYGDIDTFIEQATAPAT